MYNIREDYDEREIIFTKEFAQMRTPPIGINKNPMTKKMGRIFLGVRIGLPKCQEIHMQYSKKPE